MAEERKTEFAGGGVIKKCPNCGAQIEAFQARCPACGFEIRGEEEGGSTALKNFIKKYKATDDSSRAETVKLFPIPNTVEDILEFTIFASQQIKAISQQNNINDEDIDLCAAWIAKLEEARGRIVMTFSKDDPRREGFETLMADSMKNIELSKKHVAKRKKKKVIMRVIKGSIVFVLILFCLDQCNVIDLSYMIWDITDDVKRTIGPISPKAKARKAIEDETSRLNGAANRGTRYTQEGEYENAVNEIESLKWTIPKNDYFSEEEFNMKVQLWESKREAMQKQLEEAKKEDPEGLKTKAKKAIEDETSRLDSAAYWAARYIQEGEYENAVRYIEDLRWSIPKNDYLSEEEFNMKVQLWESKREAMQKQLEESKNGGKKKKVKK